MRGFEENGRHTKPSFGRRANRFAVQLKRAPLQALFSIGPTSFAENRFQKMRFSCTPRYAFFHFSNPFSDMFLSKKNSIFLDQKQLERLFSRTSDFNPNSCNIASKHCLQKNSEIKYHIVKCTKPHTPPSTGNSFEINHIFTVALSYHFS